MTVVFWIWQGPCHFFVTSLPDYFARWKTRSANRNKSEENGKIGTNRDDPWDLSPPPSTEPKTPKTQKVSKKSPEKSLGPPDPGPRKSPKKVRKVKKKSENQLFSWHFLDFFGVRGRGGPNSSSGDFFETFRVFGVFGSVDGGGDVKTTPFCRPQIRAPILSKISDGGRRFAEKSEFS